MRTRVERPRHPARWGDFARLMRLLTLGDFPELDAEEGRRVLPLIANGDFFTHRQMESFQRVMKKTLQHDVESNAVCVPMMIGRGVFWDIGLFGSGDSRDIDAKDKDSSFTSRVAQLARFCQLGIDSGTLLS